MSTPHPPSSGRYDAPTDRPDADGARPAPPAEPPYVPVQRGAPPADPDATSIGLTPPPGWGPPAAEPAAAPPAPDAPPGWGPPAPAAPPVGWGLSAPAPDPAAPPVQDPFGSAGDRFPPAAGDRLPPAAAPGDPFAPPGGGANGEPFGPAGPYPADGAPAGWGPPAAGQPDPAPAAEPDPEPAAPPAAAREPGRRSPFVKVMLVIGLAAVVLAAAVGWQVARHLTYEPEPRAAVGECLVGEQPKAMKKIACGDGAARWRVLGKVDQITEQQFNASNTICAAYPAAEYTFWEAADRDGARGYALCLGPIKR
ncbi:hypothetical protein GCM10010123_32090 [Pilimelia anulata]|uniref:Uncharacterized protein n=1 Tax=Pilimelia anulata TaxID=53371 RepID=A0A8J3BD86_9ACTN|nr:hypothetical protein [Pilimelia anulata]GGJ99726.1 hypothetical protein GCM10010123_32090 [Pilimelia anulata]